LCCLFGRHLGADYTDFSPSHAETGQDGAKCGREVTISSRLWPSSN